MSPYKIEFVKSAAKEFKKLPRAVQNKVTEALFFLAQNPFSDLLKIKKLRGADALYRLRVGEYRIVYEVRQHVLIIVVIKIGHRKDVYRFL
ncbi:MAG: type II toxin-antitoxin system RelE/ParE family toxin [Deltaproteobacteria bacterium]|nr:type II toxin-antitoxin system RelE/ParE family toxin [Deltaproteobacteria bacterium]